MNEFVPQEDLLYIKTLIHQPLKNVLSKNIFYPIFLTGPSGTGKTLTVSQVCHQLNREMIRVNITIETDEDSLFGGFRLKDGNTYFEKGPVATAMERGAILLLDEYDLGSPTKILALQSVIEGSGYLIKRNNEWIFPKSGFNIIATANTKGQGDEKGSYIGTQILNEAALDRFPITLELDYPPPHQESEILKKLVVSLNLDERIDESIDILIKFANNIRNRVKNDADVEYPISTRRLVDIIKAYSIFGDLRLAVTMCLSRYDPYHKEAYLKIYDSLSPFKEKPKTKKQIAEQEKFFSGIEPF